MKRKSPKPPESALTKELNKLMLGGTWNKSKNLKQSLDNMKRLDKYFASTTHLLSKPIDQ